SAPLSGKVSRLHVVHGSVSKGQVIAEIESTDLLALQSQLLSVSSDVKVFKSELERVKKLRQSGAASAKKLQQAQADVDKLYAEEIQQKNALQLLGFSKKSIQKLLSSQKIQSSVLFNVSPIDGQIFDLTIRLGERVSENQQLFSLGETNPMLLKIKVPVALANRLKKGDQADVSGLGLGIIEHIDPDVDAVTQAVDIHVELDNSTHRIRPGQRFQVKFLMSNQDSQAHAVYQVPLNAISQFDGETVVFIKEGKAITPKVITVKNINNRQLYFSLQQPRTAENKANTLNVFVKGSTAIKSAFDATAEDA
ncbi:MAG: efflux RND transporter periplasmic adaptor subunit, partial [Thiomicrorhabdus sp.]|nr:efflux RND transporter periplasmic adaptor subunit [Thiomicrorhabdus sp.]